MPALSEAPAVRVALCPLDDLPVGLGRPFVVGTLELAVFRTREGGVFATAAACPHKGGPLADGQIVGDRVVCPLHLARFDGATGACDRADVCAVDAYPAAVEGGTVFLTLPRG